MYEVLDRGTIAHLGPYPIRASQAKKGGESDEKGDNVSWVFLTPLASAGLHGTLGSGQG